MTIFSFLLFALLFTGMPGDQSDEKTEPTWSSFDEGIEHAKKSNKKVMIDVYTNWCGWCKKLDKEVYANTKVADYLNKNYVSIKLNAESEKKVSFKGKSYTERQFAAALGVSGYPTIVFLKPNSDVITNLGGFVESERFLKILKFLGEDHYEKMKWDEYLAKEEKNTKK